MSIEFFKESMVQAVLILRQQLEDQVEAEQRPEVKQFLIREVGPLLENGNRLTTDLDSDCRLGAMGSAMIQAMADALLNMPMTGWERFYKGYVAWQRQLPDCVFKGIEEENARGAMLMSLKYRCEDLQRRASRANTTN